MKIILVLAPIALVAACDTATKERDPARETKSTKLAEAQPSPSLDSERAVAQAFFGELRAAKYSQAREKYFSPVMSKSMSAARLEKVWQALIGRAGELKRVESVREKPYGHFHLVFFRCAFERETYEVQITVDRQKKVAGLFYRTPSSTSKRAKTNAFSFTPPPYAKRDAFDEEPISLGRAPWLLSGLLSLPKGRRPKGGLPVVVLVHGSGPHDKDETIGPNKVFRDLAWGLASRRVAVLRYEKRTKTYAKEMAQQLEKLTVKEETIDDALAAVAALRKHKAIDAKRIAVLGHSLGGSVLARVARRDAKIAAFVALAANSRPLEDVVLEQIAYITNASAKPHPHAQHSLEKLRAKVARVKSPSLSIKTPRKELPLALPPRYWLDLRANPPTRFAARIKQPMLFLQGGRDYQVTRKDFAGWKKALKGKANVRYVLLDKANHLFIEGEGRSTPAEYRKAGHVSERVIDEIATFVTTKTAR